MASLISHYGWHEWLSKTNFSFLVGASHPAEMISTAIEHGYHSLCVNDFDGVYGLARAYRDRNDYQKNHPSTAPLKLHYSAEIHLQKDHDQPILLQDTLVLVAQSWEGYRRLCMILNSTHRDGKKYAHIPLEDLLKQDVKDLVVIQPMRGFVRTPTDPRIRFEALKQHFNDRLYFAISRHLHYAEDYWIRPTLALAKKLDAKCLLTQDAFFHHPQQKSLSDLVHTIRTNKTMATASEHFFPNCERHLHNLPALEANFRKFAMYEAALAASKSLADSCDFCFSSLKYHYPKEMIEPGYSAQNFLEKLTWEGAKARFGEVLPSKIVHQLKHELDLIEKLKFPDYFLTVWDIVRWARSQNILCQGRGSAANSAVCYVLGITSVDPMVFELVFERFISMERGDPPDIDVDFEHERREEVVQYIYQRYGRDKAAMVANVITYRRKGALRAVGKALGAPDALLDKAAKLCGTRHFRGNASENVLAHVIKEESEAVDAAQSQPNPVSFALWAAMAERLREFPRHLGIHSGGFMLADKPLDYLVAQEPATMKDRTVVQWCKEDIEGLGFFKIDILCLGMLTAIRKSLDYIRTCHGVDLSMATIPHEDVPTYAMIQKSDTVGTFQIESRAQMSMLPRLKPKTFYDLVIEVAIIRPGPIQGNVIHPYLKRREGLEKASYPHPKLERILKRTLGIPIFQEQLMRIAIEVGDFTAGEANELRKNIGVWNSKGFQRSLDVWTEKLIRGMRANRLPENFIEQIVGQMEGFAHYGFPESHAVSFALIAYVSSYLKRHYPAAFFAGLLNSQPMGFYSPHVLLQSAQRDGVSVLPICANRSHWDHLLENIKPPGQPPEFAIRLGLRVVAALSERGGKALVVERNKVGGAFANLAHLLSRSALHRSDLTALAAANAFHVFGLPRNEALWQAEAAPFCANLEDVEEEIKWSPEGDMKTLQRDFAAFGTSLGEHPCQMIRNQYWTYPVPARKLVPAERLATMPAHCVVDIFGMTIVKQAPPSAKGMVFLTLEDETGFFNLVFTPQSYTRMFELVESQSFLCLRGKLQKAGLYHSIMVQEIYRQTIPKADVIPLNEKKDVSVKEKGSGEETFDLTKELQPPRSYM